MSCVPLGENSVKLKTTQIVPVMSNVVGGHALLLPVFNKKAS
jgi:hypothetical protein